MSPIRFSRDFSAFSGEESNAMGCLSWSDSFSLFIRDSFYKSARASSSSSSTAATGEG